MNGKDITRGRLKEVLHYEPETGIFTWLVSTNNRIHVGGVAGSKHHTGYIQIRIDGKDYRAHRLACLYMKGRFPIDEMDHDDHVRDNNRWSNISEATNQENHKNRSLQANNTSGCTGVCWFKRSKKWMAHIKIDGKQIYLGLFTNKLEAISARKRADIKYNFHENHGV